MSTASPAVLVTGGTGTIGGQVVSRLLAAGTAVRILSRGRHGLSPATTRVEHAIVDLATGDGVDPAFEGIETVVHLAGSARGDEEKTRHVAAAARRAGVRHIVAISVVGADRIPVVSGIDRAMFGYFGAKLAAERAIRDSGVPWSILRSTQVHDLTFATVAAMARLPLIPVPGGLRFQPIDSGEVADRLVQLALGSPTGTVAEIGGPRAYAMADLVRSYLLATGRHRLLFPLPMPGKAAAAMRAGGNLAPDHALGRRSWEDFLAAQLRARIDRTVTTG